MDRTPSLGRRRLLAAGTATLLAGLAGCNDSGSVDPGPPASQAPANTGVLVSADMALLEHDGTERLLDAYGSGPGGGEAGSDVGLVAEFENRTGLEAEAADEIVIFADRPRGDFAAYVVEGEWREATVLESVESATGLEYEARDHEGGTVYEPDGGGSEADSLGFVAEGRYAVGSVGAVEAAIETVRTTYVTAATDDPRAYLPPDDSDVVPPFVSLDGYETATVGTVAYAAADEAVAVDAELRADTESDARELADLTFVVREGLATLVDDAVLAQLEKVAIERDGSVVTISYRSDVEGAAALAGLL
ncbi:hypothetical protein BRC63_10110 [Halobacteriales archaeon QH_10_70_21]|nr:MAG: hypothetical protein BRC63_10110 [Halobacteriales archaeon QH_10_70_21]